VRAGLAPLGIDSATLWGPPEGLRHEYLSYSLILWGWYKVANYAEFRASLLCGLAGRGPLAMASVVWESQLFPARESHQLSSFLTTSTDASAEGIPIDRNPQTIAIVFPFRRPDNTVVPPRLSWTIGGHQRSRFDTGSDRLPVATHLVEECERSESPLTHNCARPHPMPTPYRLVSPVVLLQDGTVGAGLTEVIVDFWCLRQFAMALPTPMALMRCWVDESESAEEHLHIRIPPRGSINWGMAGRKGPTAVLSHLQPGWLEDHSILRLEPWRQASNALPLLSVIECRLEEIFAPLLTPFFRLPFGICIYVWPTGRQSRLVVTWWRVDFSNQPE